MEDIKYSPKSNIVIPNLHDIVPGRMIKVFPYEFIKAEKSKTFIEGNAVSIATISQTQIDLEDEHLKVLVDENGDVIKDANGDPQRYFEMFAAITSDAILDFSAQTSVYGQELKEEDSFVSLSNWFYEGELEQIRLGKMRFMPACFSIGKPYVAAEYTNGEQAIFMASGIIEAKEGRAQYQLEDMNPEGLYEYSMVNITAIESSFTNSRIELFLANGQHASLDNPTVANSNGDLVPGIKIQVEPTALVNKITAKVGEGEDTTDLDLYTSAQLIPFKATPISNQDKVTMFMDWFDYDTTMPEFIANNFLGSGAKIEVLKTIMIDTNSGKREAFFDDPEINLIKDMLAYSLAYSESFGQFERNDTGSDAGKIKAGLTIGSTKAHLVALEGKDSIKVIDGLYETYIRAYPSEEGTVKNRAVKQILAALSRFIYSTYAIGKGENSFNEVYLPWFLRPTDKLTLFKDGSNYTLNEDAGFKLFSRWFDTTQSAITVENETDISRIRMIQTDRKLTIPEVPNSIGALTKLPLPGDVNTKSSQDLSYMWYLPFTDNTQLEKLFLNSATISIDNNNKKLPVKLQHGPAGKPYVVTEAIVKAAASKQYRAPLATITIASLGTTAKVDSAKKTVDVHITDEDGFYSDVQDLIPGYPYPADNVALPDELIMKYISQELGLDTSLIRLDVNNSNWRKSHSDHGEGRYNVLELYFEYTVQEVAPQDVFVFIKSQITTISTDRQTLFDKPQWRKFITKELQISNGLTPFNLLSEDEEPISVIDEITIHSLWGNEVIITVAGHDFNIPMFNDDDETVGVQRILFT